MAKKVKKILKERTRNAGTMTESMFLSFIRETLRKKSMYWKPIQIVRKKAKYPYKGDNKRLKFVYKCFNCHNLFPQKETAVHHISPVGSLKNLEDLPSFVNNLFCEEDNLCLLCNNCHDKIHGK